MGGEDAVGVRSSSAGFPLRWGGLPGEVTDMAPAGDGCPSAGERGALEAPQPPPTVPAPGAASIAALPSLPSRSSKGKRSVQARFPPAFNTFGQTGP